MRYDTRGIGHILFHHHSLKNDTGNQYDQKANQGHHHGNTQLIIFFRL